MIDPILNPASVKAEAPEIDRIRRQDLKITWVRYIRGGILGRYTEAMVEHPTLGKTKLLVALPMSKDAIAGWIETFVPKRLYREFVSKGVVYLGVPAEEMLEVRVTPHRWKVPIAAMPRWSHFATARPGKPRRLVTTIFTPPPPKPKGEWGGDPIRDRRSK